MVTAFSTFARGGITTEPIFILRVYDRNGVLLEDHIKDAELRSRRALSPEVAYRMVLMMRKVVEGGTGTVARFRNGEDQLQPAAGKTGTTDDFGDAWFVGYTPKIATAVWVGNDDHRVKMRRVFGASIPGPTWKAYMQGIYKDRPLEQFEPPEGAVGVSVPGATVRPVSYLEDLQVEGEYAYPFEIDLEALGEETTETQPGEEPAPSEDAEPSTSPAERPKPDEDHPVYF
jgi:penicillin-binding protein 1A